MTDLFALVYYNSEIHLCTKISFVYKTQKTLSLREIHPSNVLLNHLKCFVYILQYSVMYYYSNRKAWKIKRNMEFYFCL